MGLYACKLLALAEGFGFGLGIIYSIFKFNFIILDNKFFFEKFNQKNL